jgi:hypothetical protein
MQSSGMDSVPSCPTDRCAWAIARIHAPRSQPKMPNSLSQTGYGQLNPAGIVRRVIGIEPLV